MHRFFAHIHPAAVCLRCRERFVRIGSRPVSASRMCACCDIAVANRFEQFHGFYSPSTERIIMKTSKRHAILVEEGLVPPPPPSPFSVCQLASLSTAFMLKCISPHRWLCVLGQGQMLLLCERVLSSACLLQGAKQVGGGSKVSL